jgi:RNA polymerase sigma-70 factor (ECF subfamily)
MTPRSEAFISDPSEPPRAVHPALDLLLHRTAEGDKRAFAELYDQLASRVLGLARSVLRDQAQSEEVAQEIFLEVWQSATRFDSSKGHALTWILTMTRRRAIDRVRASQASRERDERIGLRDIEVAFDSVAESVEVHGEHRRVVAAMASLTERQREAISLSYLGGYSHAEVSDILNVPIGTVKTRVRDGLIKLRLILESQELQAG